MAPVLREPRLEKGPRDDVNKKHPSLMPWAELGEDDRRTTITGVRASLVMLESFGYVPYQTTDWQPWQRFERSGEVTAARLDREITWTTDDGQPLTGKAGDWLLTGPDGRQWTIGDAQLHETYRHVAGEVWRRHGLVWARPAIPQETIQTAPAGHFAANYRRQRSKRQPLRNSRSSTSRLTTRQLAETKAPSINDTAFSPETRWAKGGSWRLPTNPGSASGSLPGSETEPTRQDVAVSRRTSYFLIAAAFFVLVWRDDATDRRHRHRGADPTDTPSGDSELPQLGLRGGYRALSPARCGGRSSAAPRVAGAVS